MSNGWIGVDLDGTLAMYPGTYDKFHGIGEPIPLMVNRVQRWLSQGIEVRILTARAASKDPMVTQEVQDWCLEHIGQALPVTCQKDFSMIELWDDRAVQVIPNKGVRVDGITE